MNRECSLNRKLGLLNRKLGGLLPRRADTIEPNINKKIVAAPAVHNLANVSRRRSSREVLEKIYGGIDEKVGCRGACVERWRIRRAMKRPSDVAASFWDSSPPAASARLAALDGEEHGTTARES